MPRAELAITIPESVWMGELSRARPDATFEILTAFPRAGGAVALAEVTADGIEEVLAEMAGYDQVPTLDVLQQRDGIALVQFETSAPVMLVPVHEAGTPLEFPFTVADGHVDWEVVASHDRLSALGDQLAEFGIEFEVVAVHHEMETHRLLTPDQRALVGRAVEEGYYDTPRGFTLTELAEAVGIAKSTASETLHRAEGKIIKAFVDESADVEAEAPTLRQ